MEETNATTTKNTETLKPKKGKVEKEKRTTKKGKSQPDQPTWWKDGRFSKAVGLLLVVTSFVMLVSFTSYLFNLADDQSEVLSSGVSIITSSDFQVKNALGRLGAGLAHLFMDNLFGLAAYFLVLSAFVVGFNLLVQKKVFQAFKLSFYSLLGIVWCSAVLAFLNALIQPQSTLSWGGAFGDYLTGTTGYLTGLLSPLGVGVMLLSVALIFAILVYNISFSFLLDGGRLFNRKLAADMMMADETAATVAAYKDTDENIFAKDNISEMTPPAESLEETVNPEEDIQVIDLDTGQELKKPSAKAKKSDLQLEVEEAVAETVAQENIGSLDTEFDPTLDLSGYEFPTLDLLEEYGSDKVKIDAEELERNKNQIITTLNNYQIEISKIKATIGPTVTLYEIVPAP